MCISSPLFLPLLLLVITYLLTYFYLPRVAEFAGGHRQAGKGVRGLSLSTRSAVLI